MPNNVSFAPNVPQQLAIKAEGVFETGRAGDQVRYELADGRTLVLAPDVAAKLNLMEIAPGETFFLCKYWNGERKQPVRWNVWLSPDSEMARAAVEEDALAHQLRQSIANAGERKAVQSAVSSSVPVLATGTYGPQAVPAPVALKHAAVPRTPIPWNVAFREVLHFVVDELDAAKQRWPEATVQDAVSTVLISAARAGMVSVWDRGERAQ